MTFTTQFKRSPANSALTALLVLASAAATAAANPNEALGNALEADIKVAAAATKGKWVELATGSWAVRHFVAVLEGDRSTDEMLIHFRVDHPVFEDSAVSSVTQTTRVDCDHATKKVIATYGYDLQGKQVFANQTPEAASLPIERPTGGPFQMICSGMYLLDLVPNGHQRYGQALAERKTARSARLPDRPIPLPAPR